jgi:hypothetical protein
MGINSAALAAAEPITDKELSNPGFYGTSGQPVECETIANRKARTRMTRRGDAIRIAS